MQFFPFPRFPLFPVPVAVENGAVNDHSCRSPPPKGRGKSVPCPGDRSVCPGPARGCPGWPCPLAGPARGRSLRLCGRRGAAAPPAIHNSWGRRVPDRAGVVFITSLRLFIQAQKNGTIEMLGVPARANRCLVQRLSLLCPSVGKPKHMLDVSRGVHNVSYLFKVCFEATTYKFVS